jgi:large subunit ribosomal protein L22
MQAQAILRKIRVSPQKLNLVAQAIRGMSTRDADHFLRVCQKRVAKEVSKTLLSAVANAENNHGMDVDDLYVKEAFVGTGFVLKRFVARARGRGNVLRKPFSHLTIIVADKEEEED